MFICLPPFFFFKKKHPKSPIYSPVDFTSIFTYFRFILRSKSFRIDYVIFLFCCRAHSILKIELQCTSFISIYAYSAYTRYLLHYHFAIQKYAQYRFNFHQYRHYFRDYFRKKKLLVDFQRNKNEVQKYSAEIHTKTAKKNWIRNCDTIFESKIESIKRTHMRVYTNFFLLWLSY